MRPHITGINGIAIAAALLLLVAYGCLPNTAAPQLATGTGPLIDVPPAPAALAPLPPPDEPALPIDNPTIHQPVNISDEPALPIDNPTILQPVNIKIENPYRGGKPFKAQLHAHTTESDGKLSPHELALFYRDAGYQVLTITDHWKFTPDPKVPGILVLTGSEQHPDEGHLMVYGAEATPDINYIRPAQIRINRMLELGGIAGLAHPNVKYEPWTEEEIAGLSGFSLIEVFNGLVGTAEDKWDYALKLQPGRKIWGTAVDDFHTPEHFGKGWVVIFADELSNAAVMESLKEGNFYATQGPELSIEVIGHVIRVQTDSSSHFDWIADGDLISSRKGTMSSEYRATGQEKYIRVTMKRDRDGKMAWSQPFFIKNNSQDFQPRADPKQK